MATILIIEQSPFMRGSLRFIVETAGHTVVGDTNNSVEGVELCRELKPDVIIIDFTICEMGSYAIAKEIREIDPTIKIIVASMPSNRDRIEDALRNGACGHIEKPYKYADIEAEITRIVS